MKDTWKQSYWDVLYLAACALHGKAPAADRIQAMNLADVYRMARFHDLTAMTQMALESAEGFQYAEPPLAKRWKEDTEKAIRKNLLLDTERAQILRHMEEQGIWYMPLKGSVLKDLYPKYGMRQMVDNDILYDSAYRKQMFQFMRGRGYKAAEYNKANDDSYEKPPVYNFELHAELFSKARHPAWHAYYKDVKDRLIKTEGTAFGYQFRDEDFYIYMVIHSYKHYNNIGIGLRSLADIYLYVEKKGAHMDWNYIAAELDQLGASHFERQSRLLAQKLLSDPEHFDVIALTEEEQALLSCFAKAGAFGTTEKLVEKKMREIVPEGTPVTVLDKLRYVWTRLFPDLEWFQKNEPFYANHRWLIPFFLVFRVFRGLALKRQKITREFQAIKHAGEETPD